MKLLEYSSQGLMMKKSQAMKSSKLRAWAGFLTTRQLKKIFFICFLIGLGIFSMMTSFTTIDNNQKSMTGYDKIGEKMRIDSSSAASAKYDSDNSIVHLTTSDESLDKKDSIDFNHNQLQISNDITVQDFIKSDDMLKVVSDDSVKAATSQVK